MTDALDLAVGQLNDRTGNSFSIAEKAKELHKWGYLASTANSTWETVQEAGGTETILTTNAITVVDTTNAGDAGEEITVEGLYLTATDDYVFISQTVTLTGTTAVDLTTPLAFCSRLYISAGESAAAGTITVNAGEGGTEYNRITIGDSQSEKAATGFSYRDGFIMTSFGASMLGSSNTNVDFRVEQKRPGQPWRPFARFALRAATQTTYQRMLPTCDVFLPNTLLRVRCSSSASGASIEAHFDGFLAIDTAKASETPADPA